MKINISNQTQYKHIGFVLILRGKLCKPHGKHRCCVGTYGKLMENCGFALDLIENAKKTQVLRWNLLKTQGKYKCCVGTYGKRNENLGFAWDPIENVMKTQLCRGNLWKKQ